MKTAWAIICCLVLAGTPFLLAQTPSPACAKQTLPACCRHGVMPCCAAQPASGSQSAPTAPVPSSKVQSSQFSLLAAAFAAWTLPETSASSISSASAPPLMVAGVPLFARDCARLI
jgi:hypothetical protein